MGRSSFAPSPPRILPENLYAMKTASPDVADNVARPGFQDQAPNAGWPWHLRVCWKSFANAGNLNFRDASRSTRRCGSHAVIIHGLLHEGSRLRSSKVHIGRVHALWGIPGQPQGDLPHGTSF
ncbi:hypothetical protein N7468_006182 [Penicillium chermesinum]|uniref:Uncharacterized protein n=1 Tax=Penicillium chermesinum TaxID=63820 RepID=A0A9W9TJB9_9EURO|nr:uncharacterized protein N7468_006182 [Penicillium chermesinum]KAJ5224957.1 hypothetical protein N7468_006182 [Penicillium chermesinum]